VTVAAEGLGLGRVGPVIPIERESLLAKVRNGAGDRPPAGGGPMDGEVTRVAVGAGACGDLLNEVIASGRGLLPHGRDAPPRRPQGAAAGVTVACALHSNSERPTLPRLAERLRAHLPRVHFELSVRDRDPFSVW
jgi:hypothetical protein